MDRGFAFKYIGVLLACLTAGVLGTAIRRVWFHPLSSQPGPKLWAASRLPYVYSLLRGSLNDDILTMHRKYGDIVRLGPNELSFATEDAWKDIYMYRPGHKETKKDPHWYWAPNDMPQNIVTTTDTKVRARMRRLFAPSFNQTSLRSLAPVLDSYAEKFMSRIDDLHDQYRKAHGAQPFTLDFLEWTNFYTMDIMSDFALGESFHCLDNNSYHPWVATLFMFFKGMVIASAARFFSLTDFLLHHLIPKDIIEKQKQHTEFSNRKILQRLETKTNRPDLVSPFLKDMQNHPDKMSLGEIQSTFAMILIAGSETPSTTLVGVWYQLATNPGIQTRLWNTLSKKFTCSDDITVETSKDIPYLDAVINEALRLCYAIPGGFPRVVPEGGDVYAGHFLPAGTVICIRPHAIHHSEKYFKNAYTFVPERWLPLSQRPVEYAHDHLEACQPFSVGPTDCIGKSLAWAEMRVLIAKVIWAYILKMPANSSFRWEKQRMMMIVEKDPLWLAIEKRTI